MDLIMIKIIKHWNVIVNLKIVVGIFLEQSQDGEYIENFQWVIKKS